MSDSPTTPTWLKLVKLCVALCAIGGIYLGIQYLEQMRTESSITTRANNEAALEAARDAQPGKQQ